MKKIAEKQANFVSFVPISGMSYPRLKGFEVNFDDAKYMKALRKRMESRLTFISNQNLASEGYNTLAEEAISTMRRVIAEVS